jgi:SPP1 family predicted phage head-tail adaptor
VQIGKLRHRVTIQKPDPSAVRDAVGERSTTWIDVITCWASVVPTSTSERNIAAQAHSFVSHRVTLRWCSELSTIDASWRVLFGERALPIEGVRNLDERNQVLELVCVEGGGQE